MKNPALQIDALSLSFADGQQVFDQLSLTAEAGTCTCILGPSGCGKSTLLRLISGTDSYRYDGSIQFHPVSAARTACAWMGQDDLLLPWMNLLDNVLLGARLRKEVTAELRERAMRLIEEAGLLGYEKALPSALSGGMRQRGALLRTLMEERPVLLMDEPFSALDALTRTNLQNIASRMSKGATVLLVTHDAIEALRMANRIVVLSGIPTRVRATIDLSGTPPRLPDDPEITNRYATLMNELLEVTAP